MGAPDSVLRRYPGVDRYLRSVAKAVEAGSGQGRLFLCLVQLLGIVTWTGYLGGGAEGGKQGRQEGPLRYRKVQDASASPQIHRSCS